VGSGLDSTGPREEGMWEVVGGETLGMGWGRGKEGEGGVKAGDGGEGG